MKTIEHNIDRLVGSTHNFGGLSSDNIASTQNKLSISNPRNAAIEGLEKMRFIYKLGIPQIVLPPLIRPNIPFIRKLGFKGPLEKQLKELWRNSPQIAESCFSSSGMWTANAGTISSPNDTADKKVHFTPANLSSNLHRSIEADENYKIFKQLFPNKKHFTIHKPVHHSLLDEGAANHCRLSPDSSSRGINLFVYGHKTLSSNKSGRQSLEAFQSTSRIHKLNQDQTLFIQQDPKTIKAGAFHNDVVSVSHLNFLFHHERAFENSTLTQKDISSKYESTFKSSLNIKTVLEEDIPLSLAIKTYLFNSQIISSENGMLLIAPYECKQSRRVSTYINKLIASKNCPLKGVHYLKLNQSMKNGGGPACLRLRTSLTLEQSKSIHQGCLFTYKLFQKLKSFINENYPTTINYSDFQNAETVDRHIKNGSELHQILGFK